MAISLRHMRLRVEILLHMVRDGQARRLLVESFVPAAVPRVRLFHSLGCFKKTADNSYMFYFFAQFLIGALVSKVLPDPIGNLRDSFIDNVFRDSVMPAEGSILYCDLAFGSAEHSGVYVGNGQIVHLDGSGSIELVTPSRFLNRLGGFNSAISIYVSCRGDSAVGNRETARRALGSIGKSRSYNLIMDNCHQFTSGCITGNYENSDNFLWMLKETTRKEMGADTWRVWEKYGGQHL